MDRNDIEVVRAAAGNEVPKIWWVTDLDRLGWTLHGSRAEADAAATEIADKHSGNTLYVLEVVSAFKRPRDRAYVLDLGLIEAAP